VLFWLAIFWTFFAWYVPIEVGDRFVLPLVPPILTYAAIGLLKLATVAVPGSSDRFGRTVLAACLVWSAVFLTATFASQSVAERFPHVTASGGR
jgi:hypothetical protein